MVRLACLNEPWRLGNLVLNNRVVMGALTRNRNLVPGLVNAEYYEQRAGAGLVISEGILVEPQGTEWPEAPGLWMKKQIDGWRLVTQAVHNRGGTIFAQLWHLGRAANAIHNCGIPPPAPSPIQARRGSNFRLLAGRPGYSVPQEITDPNHYITMFKQAAINASLAGFDGIELNSGNGYLFHQFIESQSNQRSDEYGGSIPNRNRFLLQTVDQILEVYPASRIGIKLNPCGGNNDMGDNDVDMVQDQYTQLITQLNQRKMGYVQLARHFDFSDLDGRGNPFDLNMFRHLFTDTKILFNGNFTATEAASYISSGWAHAITFGRHFIANPDLPYRLINGKPLATVTDPKCYYTYPGTEKHVGYSDFRIHPDNHHKLL